MAEAVGPSRVKQRADEALVKRGEGWGGEFRVYSTSAIFNVIIDFAAKFPPVRVLVHTYMYIVQVLVHTYIPRDE